jgi:hypothetical protein
MYVFQETQQEPLEFGPYYAIGRIIFLIYKKYPSITNMFSNNIKKINLELKL